MTKMFDKERVSEDRVGQRPRPASVEGLSIDRLNDLAGAALARLVRNGAGSGGALSRGARAVAVVAPPHVLALADALASGNPGQAEILVDDLLDAGLTIDELFFDHLTPATQLLGRWWEADRLTFTEVTLAAARVQTILRGLPGHRARPVHAPFRGALFVSVPGEQHTVGVCMAAELFRRRGWDVSLHVGLGHDDLVRCIAGDDRRLVGLSCSGRRTLPALRRLVADLRTERPDLSLVLSGTLALEDPEGLDLPRFDGIVGSLQDAEAVMERARARARSPR